MIGIYRIVSPTYKIYIGQSKNIEKRKRSYKNLNCKDQPAIYNSLLKHGFESHSFDVMYDLKPELATQEELDRLECYYIDVYKSMGYEMLNLKEGGLRGRICFESLKKRSGENHCYYKKQLSEVSRLKMSLAKIGRPSPKKGKKVSEETLNKMRNAQRDRPKYVSIETRQKLSNAAKIFWLNRKIIEENKN